MKELNDQELKDLIAKSNKPVVIQLSADWCSACKQLKPKMEELVRDIGHQAELVYQNIDQNQELISRHGIRSIPTVLIYKNNQHVDTFVGNKAKEEILALIKKHV